MYDNDEFLLQVVQSQAQDKESNFAQDSFTDQFDSHGERIVEVELDPEPLEGSEDCDLSTQSTIGLDGPLFTDEPYLSTSVDSFTSESFQEKSRQRSFKEDKEDMGMIRPYQLATHDSPTNITWHTAYLIPQDNRVIQKQVLDFHHSLLDNQQLSYFSPRINF